MASVRTLALHTALGLILAGPCAAASITDMPLPPASDLSSARHLAVKTSTTTATKTATNKKSATTLVKAQKVTSKKGLQKKTEKKNGK